MSWFSAIKAGVKAVLGGGTSAGVDNVMTVARGVGNWIDELNLTDEEKARMGAERMQALTNYLVQIADENTERSITRRLIAVWIIRVEVFMLIWAALMYRIDPGWSEYVLKVAVDSPLGLMTLGISAFFFGTHLLRASKG